MERYNKNITVKYWNGEFLGKDFSADTETELINGPTHIPELVLTTAYAEGNTGYIIKKKDTLSFFNKHKSSRICFHNASFDLAVIEKDCGFEFHEQIINDKILDTAILYRLLHIAAYGHTPRRWSLDFCIEEILKKEMDKDESIRLTFGHFLKDGKVYYEMMSERHKKYAVLDAVGTEEIKKAILTKINDFPTSTNFSHTIQLMGEISLDKIKRNGIAIDLEYAIKLRKELDADMQKNAEILGMYGLVRGQKGFQKRYEEICKHLELDLPVTGKTQKLSMKSSDLEQYRGNQFVDALIDFLGHSKRKDFLKLLNSERIHPRYTSIMNTLRTSCTSPNIQNMPRIGGVREAFIPAKGKVFIDIDYSSIELYALAFLCKNKFKYSVLYDKLNAGADVHVYAASKIYNIPEKEVTKDQRQIAKICNYGLAANMSSFTFARHMKNNGVDLSIEEAGNIKKLWSEAFPEIKKYWKNGYGKSTLVTDTGFVRAACNYTVYLNTPFQSKCAEGAKIALYNLNRAGFKIVAFIHDQVIIEHDKETAEKAMKEAEKIMIDSMKIVMPSMDIKAEGEIKERFNK